MFSENNSESTLVVPASESQRVLTQTMYIVGTAFCDSDDIVTSSSTTGKPSKFHTSNSSHYFVHHMHLTLHQILEMIYERGRCGKTFLSLLNVKGDVGTARRNLSSSTENLVLSLLSLMQLTKHTVHEGPLVCAQQLLFHVAVVSQG